MFPSSTLRKSLTAAAVLAGLALSPLPALAQVDKADAYQADSAILSAGSRAQTVKRLRQVPSVGVVWLDYLHLPRGGLLWNDRPDPSEFRMEAERHAGDIQKLRQALRANPATRHALEDRGIAISRVVGIRIFSNGAILVYLI
jgi:hypothetical protein